MFLTPAIFPQGSENMAVINSAIDQNTWPINEITKNRPNASRLGSLCVSLAPTNHRKFCHTQSQPIVLPKKATGLPSLQKIFAGIAKKTFSTLPGPIRLNQIIKNLKKQPPRWRRKWESKRDWRQSKEERKKGRDRSEQQRDEIITQAITNI